MRKKSTIIIAFVLIFAMVFSTATVFAKTKDEINSEIKKQQEELKKGKAESDALAEELEKLETRIGETENELATLNKQISKTEGQMATVEAELKEAEEKVNTQSNNLNQRLRAMYKNGSVGFLDVILSSGSISELISNLEMVKMIYSNDQEVLQTLEENYEAIDKKKKELEELQTQMNNQKLEQMEVQQSLTADKDAVAKKKGSVDANNSEIQDNIADLNAEAARIDSIIANNSNVGSNNSSSSSGSSTPSVGAGGFTWPVPGYSRVSSNYGWRNCPFHGREFHSGIDIPASYGEPVVAAASGTVIFSGYLGSYGNAIIINHGGGLYTLYGHNSSLVKGYGAQVSQGQTIARIGSTGSSTGNHSHFEVRKGSNSYSNHTNPWNYL